MHKLTKIKERKNPMSSPPFIEVGNIIKGKLVQEPIVGKAIILFLLHGGKPYVTTQVDKIIDNIDGVIRFRTKNSFYKLEKL